MSGITTLFFDIGGVILTNGWDTPSRERAAEKFDLNWDEFERRHHETVDDFERGKIGIEDYIARVAFDKPRNFTPAEFREFIFAESAELAGGAHEFVNRLSQTPGLLVATINNEGREVNEYRITRFGLARTFKLFFSSCYVGLRKPDPAIFRLALDVTRREAAESVFIDDREENVIGARRAGIAAIQYQNVAQLEAKLREMGVVAQEKFQAEAARES